MTTSLKVVKTGSFGVLGLSSESDSAVATTSAAATTKAAPKSEKTTPAVAPAKEVATKDTKKEKKPTPEAKESTPAREWTDDLQADFDRIFSVGEECISAPELKTLLTMKGRGSDHAGFNLYDGFEPSGRMHIAQGVFKAMNVNKCTAEGTNSTFVFWVADWFALMNDKMGGDLDKIQTVGYYLQEVWKAAGMDLSHVVFKWASEEITTHADKYWPTMLDVARRFNITRIKKCCQIMGRLEGSLTAAQVLYPLMQCTDVFFLQADICQLGVDQRKVNMLAREYCDAAGRKHKPIILSHHMLYGLKAGQEKMSKSDPDSAVFMEDTVEDVERKIMNAYCPSTEEASPAAATGEAQDAGKESMHLTVDALKNPCLDYIQHIIFSPPGATFTAGTETFADFATVREAFVGGKISEEDLKRGLIVELNRLLEPVRSHFTNDDRARDLLAKVRQYKKETTTASTSAAVRRLDLVTLKKVSPGSHLVFMPLPTAAPTLQQVVTLLAQLRLAKADQPIVLFLSDWTARVCSACQADVKAIDAFYAIMVAALQALDSERMSKVQVLRQSEAILLDPSNYWISVINAGRHFMLDQVMGPSMEDSQGVGIVIGRLMRVADVAGVEPATVAMDVEDTVVATLVKDFFVKLPGVTVPAVTHLNGTDIRLQEPKESEALKTENDEYFVMDDPKVHGKSKMKKAFCMPGNATFCPPIAFGDCFCLQQSSTLTVNRSPENGGPLEYTSKAQLEADFASGALHPGDLKAAVTPLAVTVLEKVAACLKPLKAVKDLKAFAKKMAKSKK